MIIRQKYLDRLIAYQDTDLVKVVTGIRRCGKSTLLDMMRDHLRRQGVPESPCSRSEWSRWSSRGSPITASCTTSS